MDYFKIFGIHPPRLDLDLIELEKRYYQASLRDHPDRKADEGGNLTQQKAAELNQAYKTLKNIWARAEYMLRSNNLNLNSKLPSHVSELYFEAQEAEDRDEIARLHLRLKEDRKILDMRLSRAFAHYDRGLDQAETLQLIRDLVVENKYISSMMRDIEEKLEAV